jgi:integrase
MSKNQNSIFQNAFIPAQLHIGTAEWFVWFSAVDPETGKQKRKKIKINRIKSHTERKRYARHLIEEINDKLYSGWNPWLVEECANGLTPLQQVLPKFIRQKEKELRPASMRSYHSYMAIFENYLRDKNLLQQFTMNFKQNNAVDFMNWVYHEKDVSGKTFNNYRTFFKNLWNWMKAHDYAATNVFDKIQKKKETQKERMIIDNEDHRAAIKEWFKEHDYNMYIVCLLVYHTLIRPGEIVQLKRGHFNFQNQTILIPSGAAKNGTSRISTIPDVILGELIAWDCSGAQPHEYIFGSKLQPSLTMMDSKNLAKRWARMRNKLTIPTSYQLYSLRDTGIVMLFRSGVAADEIMKQAGHHSLEVTTIYARHYNNDGSDIIKEKAKQF